MQSPPPAATPIEPSDALLADAAERLAAVRARIAAAAARAGRDPASITLVGVAKRQPPERVLATLRAGLGVLGENFVQEARSLRERLEAPAASGAPSAVPRVGWRLIGRLQRNKAAEAARVFDAVDSVDRVELLAPLDRQAAALGRALDVLLQVNVGDEPQKGGAAFDDVPALARAVAAHPALRLRGLMAIPPATEDPQAARPSFRRLREARDAWARELPALAAGELSMGMSNDFEVAIEEGATLVRVGTALFGPRVERP